MPLHRVWEYRDIGRLFITVGGEESDNRGAEVGLGGGDSPGQSGGHSPPPPATYFQLKMPEHPGMLESSEDAFASQDAWHLIIKMQLK